VVSGSWGNTLRGDRFVQPGPDQDMILFATDENLRMLSSCRLWLMDGTFKCVPGLFGQLYTIPGEMGSYVVPLVFTLLPNKQADTYRKMFERLNFSTATSLVSSYAPQKSSLTVSQPS